MAKPIYIASDNESHSIKRQKPDCNVNDIKNPVYFQRGRDAIKAGRDACGHCSRYWRSRHNATKHKDAGAEGLAQEMITE